MCRAVIQTNDQPPEMGFGPFEFKLAFFDESILDCRQLDRGRNKKRRVPKAMAYDQFIGRNGDPCRTEESPCGPRTGEDKADQPNREHQPKPQLARARIKYGRVITKVPKGSLPKNEPPANEQHRRGSIRPMA